MNLPQKDMMSLELNLQFEVFKKSFPPNANTNSSIHKLWELTSEFDESKFGDWHCSAEFSYYLGAPIMFRLKGGRTKFMIYS